MTSLIKKLSRIYASVWLCKSTMLFLFLIVCLGFANGAKNETNRYVLNLIKHSSDNDFNAFMNLHELSKKHHLKKHNTTNDSIALTRYLDNEFYGEIQIGKPIQVLKVNFDTSWSLSWVMSSRCNGWNQIGCYSHNKYDHDHSNTYKKDGTPYIGNEGLYNLTGFYSYDNIHLAHSNATHQSFVEMTDVPSFYFLNKADGILGLGLKTDSYNPFFYTLLNQKVIKDPIFSIYLNRDKQSSRGGNIMLGFYSKKHIHMRTPGEYEEITYLPVDDGQYWMFTMDKMYFEKNPKNYTTFCNNTCKVIVCSANNRILGPPEDIAEIHDQMHARKFIGNRYTVDCDTVNKLPVVTFVLGGKNFTLKGPEYTVKMSKAGVSLCLSAFGPTDESPEQGKWIFGGAFLSEYYSIYNIHEKTIGFVKAA